MKFKVVEFNCDYTKAKKPAKAKNKSLYRDSKEKPHPTVNGKGLIARLLRRGQ